MKPVLLAVAAMSLACLLGIALSSPGAVASTEGAAAEAPPVALSSEAVTLSDAGYILVSRIVPGEASRVVPFPGEVMSGGAFQLTRQSAAAAPATGASGCCCKGYLPCVRK